MKLTDLLNAIANHFTHRQEIEAKHRAVHQAINEQTKAILSSQIQMSKETKASAERTKEYTREVELVAGRIAKVAGR